MFQRIGIALAAYQPNEDFFFEQLESIQAQTHQDWVCCVQFDSPLDTFRKAARFSRFFEDTRFRWAENSGKLGHLENFERAIQATLKEGAEAIACCDQDDIWYPQKLEISLAELNRLGRLGMVFSDMNLIDEVGKISDQTAWTVERRGVGHTGSFDLIVRNVVSGTGMLMDAELVKKFPSIPEKARFHDHWYPLVAASVSGMVKAIHQPLYAYRIHGSNVVGITPYRGVLNTSGIKQGVLQKSQSVWDRSHALAREAEGAGLPFGGLARAAFLGKWDMGSVLLVRGLACLISDPALARACFARALGKVIEITHIAKSQRD
jgi:hypothetical protein